jgi:hypothetical protein
MSKVMLALGSFIVGACCASAISFGIQTSTWAQVGPPLGSVPVVPALKESVLEDSIMRNSSGQQLDGLECMNCVFDNVGFTYSGGAFRLVNPRFINGMRIHFGGAAANTAVVLALLQALNNPQRPVPPPAFKPPAVESASLRAPATIELITTAPSP